MANNKLQFAPGENDKDKLSSILGQFAGYSSMCWEKPEEAGEYQPEKALKGVDSVVTTLNQYFHMLPKGGNG